MNIHCKGILQKNTETQQSLQRYSGTLIIQAENISKESIVIQEVPLLVQVGTSKIQVIDTDLPLVVANKQTKPLTVINLGTIPVLISASFVQEIESTEEVKYFFVQPENLLIQPKETGCFLITYRQQTSNIPKM